MCVYTLCECVCVCNYSDRRISPPSPATGEGEEAELLAHCVSFFRTASSLLTTLSSRHSQDLNNPPPPPYPELLRAQAHKPQHRCVSYVNVCAQTLNAICVFACVCARADVRVYVCPQRISLLAAIALWTHRGLPPSRGDFFILLSVVSLLSPHTHAHIHPQMHIHAQ